MNDNITKSKEQVLKETRASINDLKTQIHSQMAKIEELAAWKPDLEARLTKLQEKGTTLQLGQPLKAGAADGSAAAEHIASPPLPVIHGQTSHDDDNLPWGSLPDGSVPSAATTANGTLNFQTMMPSRLMESSPGSGFLTGQLMAGLGQASPNLVFPPFSGENPKLWKPLSEQYFSMFQTHDSYFVPMSTLHFTGPAAIWLQSVQKKIAALDWESFCTLLCTRFGRDRYQLLIRQFYALKQIGSVAEYIEQFKNLMNHLISYSNAIHPLYFLTRFVEGICKDIHAVVMKQRPPDLDAACALAMLQEEVADGHRY